MNENLIALGVGYSFIIVDVRDVTHISLKNTNSKVSVDGREYVLYKATTFEESQKVDDLIDSGNYTEYSRN